MLSTRCKDRNESIIPRLLQQHMPTSSSSEIIDLRNADNWFMKANTIKLVNEATDRSRILEKDLAYMEEIGGSEAVRASLARLLREHVSPNTDISSQHMVLGAGANAILDALIEAVCDKGDLIMIATPYWSGLDVCVGIHNSASVLPVQVPFEHFGDPTSIHYYEEAFERATAPVKAVLICNPHNPLGICYPRETMQSMLQFCTEKNLHFISDEVYALSRHGDQGITSALSLGESDLVHIVYSLSKDFGCNGIRLGVVITRNTHVRMSVALSTHGQVSTVTALFAERHILTRPTIQYVLNENRRALRKSYSVITNFCKERKIQFVEADAGLFVFAKLWTGDEKHFAEMMLHEGLCLSGGLGYHMKEAGWFRICFSIPQSMLKNSLERIDRALRRTGTGTMQNNFTRSREVKVTPNKKRRIGEDGLGMVASRKTKPKKVHP